MSDTMYKKTNDWGSLSILILAIIFVIVFLVESHLFYRSCTCTLSDDCHCSYLAYIVLGSLLVIIITLFVVYNKLANNNKALLEAAIYEEHLERAVKLAESLDKNPDVDTSTLRTKAILAIINTLIQK